MANLFKTDKERRQLGRYDTPRPLSQIVADWAIRSRDDTVFEPSSGSGVFVASALHRLKALGNLRPQSQLWACDIDPTACQETTKIASLDPSTVWEGDFLEMVGVDGIKERKFDCIVGNPPYVSLHRMDGSQRLRASEANKRLNLGLDKKSSLWGYFVSASLCGLLEDGRLGLILPESILHVDYAKSLLRKISSHFKSFLLLSIRERCFLAVGAAERVVLLLGDGYTSEQRETPISLHETKDVIGAQKFLSDFPKRNIDSPLNQLNGHAVPHLLPAQKHSYEYISDRIKTVTLGSVVDIRIGVVTGANHFFLLSEAERRKYKIPMSAVVPIIAKFRYGKGLRFTDADWKQLRDGDSKCWLVYPPQSRLGARILEYLNNFPQAKIDQNKTFGKRNPWYRTDLGITPHALLQYMGAEPPRMFLLPRACDTSTNTIHRVYFKDGVSLVQRKMISLSLLSSFSQLSSEFEGRTYGSGVLKLEPSEAKRVRIFLPNDSEKNVDALFEKVDEAVRGGNVPKATSLVDKWIFQKNRSIQNIISKSSLEELLNAARSRRTGVGLR